ncbi:TPA: hypothetical protein ACGSTL_001300 [Vibrio parahaemolyticus]|uniref:hypothetical protein n=1 Tax=Vibrio campbellii TaxID=680 RepID=UPI001F076807|nr:hypothetical protein [Vibrio campbellii]UMM06718.1 hypothetical protein MKR81_27605 [Vibrio campbellii]
MKNATLIELGLESVPFPEWFEPNYYAKDPADGHPGCWFVYEKQPLFKDGEWHTDGSYYEIGIDDADEKYTALICRNLEPKHSLFCIHKNTKPQ